MTNTCIIYFSRRPDEEINFKKVIPSKGLSYKVLYQLYEHGLNTIKKSGYPYLCYTEDLQSGVSFGERISNAIEDTFRFYDHIIIIGSDCPNLDINDLHQANNQVSNFKSCIGKTYQGGTYLIGLNKETWCRSEFENLPWNTPLLAEAIQEYLSSFGDLVVLGTKAEINLEKDLLDYIQVCSKNRLWRYFKGLLKKPSTFDFSFQLRKIEISFTSLFRGPPYTYT